MADLTGQIEHSCGLTPFCRADSIAAKALMDRLVVMVPEMYGSKAQLRTLQRRVKAWRSARVTEMVLGGLRKSAAAPVEV